MKSSKTLMTLATVSFLTLTTACSDRYQEGFDAGKEQGYAQGYDRGYDDGYQDGDEAGFERARQYFASADYNQAYNAGYSAGQTNGYNTGFSAGQTAGYNTGFTAGKNQGLAQGYDMGYDDGLGDGYDMGYDDGLGDGYDLGYDDGLGDGYDLGYDDGLGDGYDLGYDDGYYDGYYGLSVGNVKALKGYSNLLSMAHNDMFDYSKIAAPKVTSRGLVANGKLLLEETSLTNKDTLKRAAVVEQYLVTEMASQVKAKFGLSAERSIKVAKAANHFRKYASKRALTNEDTDAYMLELTGSSLKTIEAAVESGNTKALIEKAAEKNGTSPEKMAEILAKHFI